ncbi:MAG: hypothetical protein R3234_12920, partial [Thermoanaerobaculia bacterium]|nr:hypothetical protein [Thermoanaerobaculia bacterium]
VRAMQELNEGLERLDSAAILALEGQDERSRKIATENGERIENQLDIAVDNITIPGERAETERLRGLYGAFRTNFDRMLDPSRSLEDRRELYFGTLVPLFQEVKEAANAVLELNQEAMVRASERASARARTTELGLLLITFLSAFVAIYLINLIGEWWRVEVQEVREAMDRVDGDRLEIRVRERDSEGLAASFNSMMGRLFRRFGTD